MTETVKADNRIYLRNPARRLYHEWVKSHVILPYIRTMNHEWADEYGKSKKLPPDLMERIPELGNANREWESQAFGRISRIFKKIDGSIFPKDKTGNYLIEMLKIYGVEIV